MKIGQWLQQARAAGADPLDAQLLLAHHLGRPRTWLRAHDDEVLSSGVIEPALADLARRAAGVPLAYLVGEREFYGLVLKVDASVLVPRPETEHLVGWALELAPAVPLARLADLGTGSGAIALAFKHCVPAFDVHASDRSAAALAMAECNGERLGLQVAWHAGDWWQAHEGRRYGLVVSNPPYVAEGDHHLDALRHEPIEALAAGPTGLDDLRRIVRGAPPHLVPGGWLLLEHGFDQAHAVGGLLGQAGFRAIETRTDLAGNPRCTGGRLPAG